MILQDKPCFLECTTPPLPPARFSSEANAGKQPKLSLDVKEQNFKLAAKCETLPSTVREAEHGVETTFTAVDVRKGNTEGTGRITHCGAIFPLIG